MLFWSYFCVVSSFFNVVIAIAVSFFSSPEYFIMCLVIMCNTCCWNILPTSAWRSHHWKSFTEQSPTPHPILVQTSWKTSFLLLFQYYTSKYKTVNTDYMSSGMDTIFPDLLEMFYCEDYWLKSVNVVSLPPWQNCLYRVSCAF